MKACICTKYGSPDVLQLREVDKPHPRDREMLVKIHAAVVTAACLICSKGKLWQMMRHDFCQVQRNENRHDEW